MGNQSLMVKFTRLFRLELDPLCFVGDRWSADGWSWSWRRPIRGGREETQYLELLDLIQHVHVSHQLDKFWWA